MPTRQDLNPLAIKELLPGICMYDVIREKKLGSDYLNFKARLVGTDIVDTIGKDFTGSLTGETHNGPSCGLSGVERTLAKVTRHCTTAYETCFMDWPDKNYRRFSFIAMPLSLNGEVEQADIILLGVHFFGYEEEIARSSDHLLPCQA